MLSHLNAAITWITWHAGVCFYNLQYIYNVLFIIIKYIFILCSDNLGMYLPLGRVAHSPLYIKADVIITDHTI